MHTVPHGYLQAFAVPDTKRRMPAVWRFDRISGEGKLVGVRDAEVVRDIYTIFGDDGAPDTVMRTTSFVMWREPSVLRGRTSRSKSADT